MAIKKKVYTVTQSYPDYVRDFFAGAAEFLGGAWEYQSSTPSEIAIGYDGPSLRLKTADGYYGWLTSSSNPDAPFMVSIAGTNYTGISPPHYSVPSAGECTLLVWTGSGGSVGIGEERYGKINIRLLAAKFDGKVDNHDVYAIGNTVSGPPLSNLIGYNGNRIENGINMSTIINGSGVYLHSLFDPLTGLYCSDVFGVKCYDSDAYTDIGTILKHEETTYVNILGDRSSGLQNSLFIKL